MLYTPFYESNHIDAKLLYTWWLCYQCNESTCIVNDGGAIKQMCGAGGGSGGFSSVTSYRPNWSSLCCRCTLQHYWETRVLWACNMMALINTSSYSRCLITTALKSLLAPPPRQKHEQVNEMMMKRAKRSRVQSRTRRCYRMNESQRADSSSR